MKGKKFEYLPHTADMEFAAYGKTFSEALENAGLALIGIMLDSKRIESSKGRTLRRTIRERADTRENLVWFTLQDVLSEIDAGNLRAYRFEVKRLVAGREFGLEGRLLCRDTRKDYSLLGVKAVTPHGLEVRERAGVFSIHVVVDV